MDAILKAIGYDKKADAGVNRFVLPVALGKTEIRRDVPNAVILEALQKRKG
jgi:3-dehydroquinate synthetase